MNGRIWVNDTAALVSCVLAMLMLLAGGCKKDEPVRVANRPATQAEEEREEPVRTRRQRPTIIGEEIPPPSTETVIAAPTRHPAFIPGYKHKPIVIKATEMRPDNGEMDSEGGWQLNNAGALTTAPVKIDFMTAKVDIEMKGAAAGDIWPEVDLNMYNNTYKLNYYPLKRTYVTTSTYHLYEIPIKPQLTPGDYSITFRYYNNKQPPEIKEDRRVNLKSITLHPYVITSPI